MIDGIVDISVAFRRLLALGSNVIVNEQAAVSLGDDTGVVRLTVEGKQQDDAPRSPNCWVREDSSSRRDVVFFRLELAVWRVTPRKVLPNQRSYFWGPTRELELACLLGYCGMDMDLHALEPRGGVTTWDVWAA